MRISQFPVGKSFRPGPRIVARLLAALLLLACLSPLSVRAAEADDAAKAESAVRDYEERIEEVAREIEAIRRELEELTREMVEGDIGQVIVYMKGKASDWSDRGIRVDIDGKVVFSRPLSTAELEVLSRGLPLELVSLRVAAGPHKVLFSPIGESVNVPTADLSAKRAVVNAWIVETQGGSFSWSVE